MLVGDAVRTTEAWKEKFGLSINGHVYEIITDPRRIRPRTVNAYNEPCQRTHRVKIDRTCPGAELFAAYGYKATFCPEDLERI